MLDAIASLFTLRWTQHSKVRPLPSTVTRTYVPTPGGDLELLYSKSKRADPNVAPLFFIHGGCGHASVWLEWMTYLHEAGYGGALYSYSARNHGASYAVPYFRMVYRTSLDDMADDLKSCLDAVRELEGGQNAVLVSHSSGGGLVQYALANGKINCRALCLLDAVPHFGNLCMYSKWAHHDPWFLLRSFFHFQHPNSPLSSTRLVHGAFFCSQFPMSAAREFARWMPAYESMGWPMGMGGSFWGWLRGRALWLEPVHVLRGISAASRDTYGDVVCVMVGSKDMMLDTGIWNRQAVEMRDGVRGMRTSMDDKIEPAVKDDLDGATIQSESGVRLVVVAGAGHHLQNDLQRVTGAEALLRLAWQC